MGDVRTWGSFVAAIRGPLSVQKGLKGAGIRLLTQTVSSPTLADQIKAFLAVYPEAKWHVYEPINRDNVVEGAKLAFGQPVETRYDFSKADVILSLDADFLSAGFPGSVRYARDYAKRRNPDSGAMNRMYAVECNPSATGAKADHHLPLRTAEIERLRLHPSPRARRGIIPTQWRAKKQSSLQLVATDLAAIAVRAS